MRMWNVWMMMTCHRPSCHDGMTMMVTMVVDGSWDNFSGLVDDDHFMVMVLHFLGLLFFFFT